MRLFSKKVVELEPIKYTPIHYERINFLNTFKHNGYTKRILNVYDYKCHTASDVVYFNNRAMTDIACTDKELFILSNYDHDININTYTLVQTDFSLPDKLKILMVQSENGFDHPDGSSKGGKHLLYKYLEENQMLETKSLPIKSPQIDDGYGTIMLEIFEALKENGAKYSKEELLALLLENANLSKKFLKAVKSANDADCVGKRIGFDSDYERSMLIRTENRSGNFLEIIFANHEVEKLTIEEVCMYTKEYQENYIYNR